MEIFIRPVDTQFYRSGLPFDAGEDTDTSFLFPPLPRTLYGALRSVGLAASLEDFQGPIDHPCYGGPGRFGTLKIRGPFLAQLDSSGRFAYQLLLPFPLDVVMDKDSEALFQFSPSLKFPDEEIGWDLEKPKISFIDRFGQSALFEGKIVKPLQDDFFFPYDRLGTYLLHSLVGNAEKLLGDYKKEKILQVEKRTGIARDNATRTIIESMLYHGSHFRLRDLQEDGLHGYGFWIDVDGVDSGFPVSGFLRLGGESRSALFETINNEGSTPWFISFRNEVIKHIAQNGKFKAYFITPALFKGGSLPCNCKNSGGNVTLNIEYQAGQSIDFHLISLCTGKPIPVGGWDIHGKEPKKMRKAVPAGSVYFFLADSDGWNQLTSDQKDLIAKLIYDHYNFKSWCSEDPWGPDSELGPGKEGFGIPLIGGW